MGLSIGCLWNHFIISCFSQCTKRSTKFYHSQLSQICSLFVLEALVVTVCGWIWQAFTCSDCQTAKMPEYCYSCQVAHNSLLNFNRVLPTGLYLSLLLNTLNVSNYKSIVKLLLSVELCVCKVLFFFKREDFLFFFPGGQSKLFCKLWSAGCH